jgi:hypothetical protein
VDKRWGNFQTTAVLLIRYGSLAGSCPHCSFADQSVEGGQLITGQRWQISCPEISLLSGGQWLADRLHKQNPLFDQLHFNWSPQPFFLSLMNDFGLPETEEGNLWVHVL